MGNSQTKISNFKYTIKVEIFVWEFLLKHHFIGNCWKNENGIHSAKDTRKMSLFFKFEGPSCPSHTACIYSSFTTYRAKGGSVCYPLETFLESLQRIHVNTITSQLSGCHTLSNHWGFYFIHSLTRFTNVISSMQKAT